MKSITLALGMILASIACAQPHQHQHQHKHRGFHNHQKRDGAAPVEWVTETDYTTEIVGYTTTIWVSEGYVPPTTSSETPSSSVTPMAAQFFQPAPSSSTPTPTPTPTKSSSVYVAPAPSVAPTTAASIASPVVAPVVAPVVPETSTSVAPVIVSTSAVVAAVASAASTASSSLTDTVDSSAVGAITGSCDGTANLCGGDMTYYDTGYPGYGSCGDQTDGTKEAVVAIPWEFMGTLSNTNPFCHRNITVYYNGKQTNARVVDKCMGCKNRDIDLSHKAFDALSDEGIGRTHATWHFID